MRKHCTIAAGVAMSVAAIRASEMTGVQVFVWAWKTHTHMLVSDGCHRHRALAADAMATTLHAADDGHNARVIDVGVKGFLWSLEYQQCIAYCTATYHVNANMTFLQH